MALEILAVDDLLGRDVLHELGVGDGLGVVGLDRADGQQDGHDADGEDAPEPAPALPASAHPGCCGLPPSRLPLGAFGPLAGLSVRCGLTPPC